MPSEENSPFLLFQSEPLALCALAVQLDLVNTTQRAANDEFLVRGVSVARFQQ